MKRSSLMVVLVCALLLAVGRVWIACTVEPPKLSIGEHWIAAYTAIAHCFVGGLVSIAWVERCRPLWVVFWILCVLEVVAAVASRI